MSSWSEITEEDILDVLIMILSIFPVAVSNGVSFYKIRP